MNKGKTDSAVLKFKLDCMAWLNYIYRDFQSFRTYLFILKSL